MLWFELCFFLRASFKNKIHELYYN
jgi:hypothetical protein